MNSNTKEKEKEYQKDVPDKTFDKLEEMWDRKILKGDDEVLESRLSSRSLTKANMNSKDEKPRPKSGRRRGMI